MSEPRAWPLSQLAPPDRNDFWSDLLRDNRARLMAVARHLLRCEQDCADAVQDALLNAIRFQEGFEGRCAVETWLHRVVVNACLMRRRGAARFRRRIRTDSDCGQPLEGACDPAAADPSARAESEEARGWLTQALARLPEPYRAILVLRDIEGLDPREAALRLSISVAAARTRHHRARVALRAALTPTVQGPRGGSGRASG